MPKSNLDPEQRHFGPYKFVEHCTFLAQKVLKGHKTHQKHPPLNLGTDKTVH